jgi:hypothetical protein
MPKPCLRLVHSSNGARLGMLYRPRDRSFRPLVIKGGARAKSGLAESSWEAALNLFNLGVLASCHNYVAFLQTSIAVLEASNRTDPERVGS